MELLLRLEYLGVITIALFAIGGILLFGGPEPEIRFSGFVLIILSLIILFANIGIQFKYLFDSKETYRNLPKWNYIGFLMMPAGFYFYNDFALGVSITLIGLMISLYAIYYREQHNHGNDELGSET